MECIQQCFFAIHTKSLACKASLDSNEVIGNVTFKMGNTHLSFFKMSACKKVKESVMKVIKVSHFLWTFIPDCYMHIEMQAYYP